MDQFKRFFDSSLGQKLIMALTGLFLCTFLIVHLSGNLQLLKNDEGLTFNQYGDYMTHFLPIKVLSWLTYTFIVLHAVYALRLSIQNRRARPIPYAQRLQSPSKWSSQNMGILGSIILVFLVIHMGDFWFKYKFGQVPYKEYRTNIYTGALIATKTLPGKFYQSAQFIEDGQEVTITRDLARQVQITFSNPLLVLVYVISMFALSMHLLHGFQSAFQTLGWQSKRYVSLIKFVGIWLFSVIIPLGFASIPIIYYFLKS